jgi:ligand-binding sensor domain-containing protein
MYNELTGRVTAIAIDEENIVWCGTEGNGCLMYDGLVRKTFTTANGLCGNMVNAVVIDLERAVWIGTHANPEVPNTSGGVSRFNGTSWKTYTVADGLGHNTVNSIAVDERGTLWFATNGGLSRFDGESWKTYTTSDGLPGNVVYGLAIDADGAVWFSSGDEVAGKGVSRFDGKTITTYTRADGLKDNRVTAITVDKAGALWFGSPAGNITRYDGNSWKTLAIPAEHVYVLAADGKGGIWAGTSNGAWRLDGEGWTSYTTADGLAGDFVVSMVVDKTGAVWFGAIGGVSKFEEERLTTVSNSQRQDYPASFGIRSAYPNPFNPSITIEFTLDRPGKATLSIYTITGQLVETLSNGIMNAGRHTIVWNARQASGVYLATLESEGRRDTRRVTFVK